MKKVILGILVTGSMLLASDKAVELKSNLFDLNKVKSDEMKGFLIGIERSMPSVTKIIKDYYEAKTCNDEFYNEITMNDMQDFVGASPAFAVLMGLNATEDETSRYAYARLIKDYRFMNCGMGKSLTVEEIIRSLKEEAKKKNEK